jgi:hypothetical protein
MRERQLATAVLVALAAAQGCAGDGAPARSALPPATMDSIAESYVKLVLALGNHDADYVDAYYGPPEWRTEAAADTAPLEAIGARADSLLARLGAGTDSGNTGTAPDSATIDDLREVYLRKQLGALRARVGMLQGTVLTFDDESQALYDAVAPHHDAAHFDSIIARLDSLLPGSGPVAPRYTEWRRGFTIPAARRDSVFAAAIAACKGRTAAHLTLPPGERFELEYVTDKPWSGYNWYQGDYHSLIQINVDLPIYIDRAIDLACHEGYPGHHVYNSMLEQHLVRDRGWVEFSVYPLFSPQSLIAEGSANYGISMAFPGDERVAFERDSLWPLAGLDPSRAAAYYHVQEIVQELSYAGNEAARRYLDGEIDGAAAADWLVRYSLSSPETAAKRVQFFDRYRSYVINYNLGQDLVKAWVERTAGSDEAKRWAAFGELLSTPRLPGGLR